MYSCLVSCTSSRARFQSEYDDLRAFQGPTTPIRAARARITAIQVEMVPRRITESVFGMLVDCTDVWPNDGRDVDKFKVGTSCADRDEAGSLGPQLSDRQKLVMSDAAPRALDPSF